MKNPIHRFHRLAISAACLVGGILLLETKAMAAPQLIMQAAPAAAAPPPAGTETKTPSEPVSPLMFGPMLHLKGGGYVAGSLNNSDDSKTLAWQSPTLRDPLVFSLNAISSVNYPLPKKIPKPVGDYSFELSGGDLIFGTLLQVHENDIEIDTQRFGKLQIARENLLRVYKWKDGADLIYLGPNGLGDWKPSPFPKDAWHEESGQLVTNMEGAGVVADLKLPDKAAIEFDIAWTTKPDFDLAFGTDLSLANANANDNQPKVKDHAFHIEVWDGNLVVQRETEQEADVESLLEVGKLPKAGHAPFVAYLDQTAGRIVVYSSKGQKLADLKVPAKATKGGTCVSLINKKGDVRLERLRISRWNGEIPRETFADQSRIHLTDGSIVYGKILSFQPDEKVFVVAVEPEKKEGEKKEPEKKEGEEKKDEEKKAEEIKVPVDRIQSLYFASKSDEKPRSIRVMDQSGARLSGDLVKVENGRVLIQVPGLKEPAGFEIATLNTITPLNQETPLKSAKDGAIGFLEMDGARLEGQLVDGNETGDASCLAWKPLLSTSSSPLKAGASGRVNYRDNGAVKPAANQAAQPQVAQPRGLANLRSLSSALGTKTGSTRGSGPRNLYLRTGDVIPSEITKIDEKGITFKTILSDSTFVSHDRVKAVELGTEPPMTPRITVTKRDRLLTLPRMQKDSPPLQLVRSMNGDYLRGRIVALDDKTLQIETRLETKSVPRDRVSKIIWLHPEEIDPTKKPATPPSEAKSTRVQAVRSDGVRLTFLVENVKDAILNGKSDVLGVCRVPVKDIDQILIGSSIEKIAAQLAYQQWKLQNAPEPKSATPGDSSSPARSESPLVGKPAPPFELEMLDGKKFNVAQSKGKVLILDFWATWCGPCLEAMPQVEKVAGEFKDQGVELVAVNLQESAKQITSLLERQKLHVNVALDIDGAVAEKYQANAIPQTVIIGRDGNIAQLFVGGGPHFDDTLREAVKAVLAEGTAKPEEKK